MEDTKRPVSTSTESNSSLPSAELGTSRAHCKRALAAFYIAHYFSFVLLVIIAMLCCMLTEMVDKLVCLFGGIASIIVSAALRAIAAYTVDKDVSVRDHS
eukprot:TRINITY_DN7171_c0_g1_i12.p1 TRINITY_DN7171_c0_g1~~TRINITY_DN7171_c0_g1_i12.p1  ORF type:complete len:117 (-),score=16.72 TRINITY_DN7171_c0_g1_i12:567-866(-)